MPSASGTRTASAWPPPTPPAFQNPPWRHEVCRPSRQKSHVPSDHANGAITKSPTARVATSAPIASTTPMNSWPIDVPWGVWGRLWNGCRSLPHTHARTTRTIASVGLTMMGSGTVSTRTSPAPYMNAARIGLQSIGCRRFGFDHRIASRAIEGVTGVPGTGSTSLRPPTRRTVEGMDHKTEVSEFLSTRRARITPDRAGLPAYGGNRRVPGLRREEVAMLAGMSVDYYTRLERGNLAGVSESVLESLAGALQLDEAEHAHLFDLARTANAGTRPALAGARRRRCARRCSASSTRCTECRRSSATGGSTCSPRTRSARRCTPSSTRTRPGQ